MVWPGQREEVTIPTSLDNALLAFVQYLPGL